MNHKMTTALMGMMLATLALVSFSSAAPDASGRSAAGNFQQRYGLLLQRNVFDRNRRANQPSSVDQTPTAPRNPYTLTGLVREHDHYAAFIENSQSNQTTEYRVGDQVWHGRITAIGLDHIEMNVNGQTRSIALGDTLDGTAPTTQALGATTAPAGNVEQMIEQLRQRRQRELHQ